ncbi:MAG: hypothetical protein OXC95_16035 [Dehalococcoidia bacterium]|nr:hypothetical protein [Dehalococcoidia bacterium]
MDTIRRPLAVVLALITIAVAIHFIFQPFYTDTLNPNQVWEILDWFMAFAVVVALVVTYMQKRGIESGTTDTNRFISVNVAFYAAAWLAIWFFWNWFDNLSLGDELQGELRLTFWGLIDPLFIIVVGSVSARLWKHESAD